MKSFLSNHKPEVLLVLVSLIIINLPLLSSAYRGPWGSSIDPTKAGVFGDFIGGYIGTIFLVVSVAFLSASVRDQKSTNEQTLRDQKLSHELTSFESRFFELLKYHRENVAEFEVGEKRGQRVFVSLIREFRQALKIVESASKALNISNDRSSVIDLAYIAFYYGVGPNSTRILESATPHHNPDLVQLVIQSMTKAQQRFRNREKESESPPAKPAQASLAALDDHAWVFTRISYSPFDGHQSRLGHYYRHLYQLVKFADSHAPEGKASDYTELVRAQLSNHEQALLCLNSLSVIGSAWNGEGGYLTKYAMIQNVPKSFFDCDAELDLEREFPGIRFEFKIAAGAAVEPNRGAVVLG